MDLGRLFIMNSLFITISLFPPTIPTQLLWNIIFAVCTLSYNSEIIKKGAGDGGDVNAFNV